VPVCIQCAVQADPNQTTTAVLAESIIKALQAKQTAVTMCVAFRIITRDKEYL